MKYEINLIIGKLDPNINFNSFDNEKELFRKLKQKKFIKIMSGFRLRERQFVRSIENICIDKLEFRVNKNKRENLMKIN